MKKISNHRRTKLMNNNKVKKTDPTNRRDHIRRICSMKIMIRDHSTIWKCLVMKNLISSTFLKSNSCWM
ncbi:hypothetical protein P3L10_013079 [Capsicum annuum]